MERAHGIQDRFCRVFIRVGRSDLDWAERFGWLVNINPMRHANEDCAAFDSLGRGHMSKSRHRSAVDGRYVSEAEAKADPERTVSERTGLGRELLVLQLLEHEARIETLEAAVAALQAKP